MGAKTTNYPTYVVYDRSFQATITTTLTGSGGGLTENNKGLSRDSDLSTAYQTFCATGNLADGGTETIWDFGQIVFNCLLYYSTTYGSNGATAQIRLDYSNDGTNWTNLITDNVTSGNTKDFNACGPILPCRYIRSQLYSGSHVGTQLTTQFFEVRLCGSAK